MFHGTLDAFRRSRFIDSRRRTGWALVPLRLIVGYGFFAHGLAKWSRGPDKSAKLLALINTPHPIMAARVVTGVELLGGIAIMLGAFVLLASIPLAASMLVAMFSILGALVALAEAERLTGSQLRSPPGSAAIN